MAAGKCGQSSEIPQNVGISLGFNFDSLQTRPTHDKSWSYEQFTFDPSGANSGRIL